MKSNFTRFVTLIVGLLLAATILAACGDTPTTVPATVAPTTAPATQPTAVPATQPTAATGGAAQVNVPPAPNPCTTFGTPKLTKKTGLKVGFSQTESNGPWRLAETKSMQDEAAKQGDTIIVTDAGGSDAKQSSNIESLISQKVDVLIIAPHAEKPEVPAILEAKAAGIPVFLVDRDVDHSLAKPCQDYVTFMGSDFVNQGKRAADFLMKSTGNKAKIIELEGSVGASPAILRKKGFDDQIKTQPGMVLLDSQTGNFNRDEGRKAMETLLQAHPDVTAVYAHNDEMAIGAVTALKAAGKKPGVDVMVVSIDGEKDGIQQVIDGTQLCTVESNPKFGPLAFKTIATYVDGGAITDWVQVQDRLFDKTNAAASIADSY